MPECTLPRQIAQAAQKPLENTPWDRYPRHHDLRIRITMA